jgi:hypothetical protein
MLTTILLNDKIPGGAALLFLLFFETLLRQKDSFIFYWAKINDGVFSVNDFCHHDTTKSHTLN